MTVMRTLLATTVIALVSSLPALGQQAPQSGEQTESKAVLRLGDCQIFVSPSRRTFIARRADGTLYYGTLVLVVEARQAEKTGYLPDGRLGLAFRTVRRGDVEGLVVRCGERSILYSEMAESAWEQLPEGKDTRVPVCPAAGPEVCRQRPDDPCTLELGTSTQLPELAVTAVEGEVVPEDAVHVVLHSKLVEEGRAYQLMSQLPQNIQQVRSNINGYIAGYFIEAEQTGGAWRFAGPTKAFRTTRLGGISVWPPIIYPDSRREALRRARSPIPVRPDGDTDLVHNLRVYIYPITVGHDGKQYVTEPGILAFFIDPKTGKRMTVFYFRGKAYGAVSPLPLRVVSEIYVHEVKRVSAGPLGIAVAYTPVVFYSRKIQVLHQPFADDSPFVKLLGQVLSDKRSTVPVALYERLAREMSRYTGGGIQ